MTIDILMPALSPTMEFGTLAKWLVKEGDRVSSGSVIAEIETDKATMEFEAADDGTIARLLVPEGTEGVRVNEPIAVLMEEGDAADAIEASPRKGHGPEPRAPSEQAEGEGPSAPAMHPRPGARIVASPLARRIAVASGVDLSSIRGSGPNGRIVRADVERAGSGAELLVASPAPPSEPTAAAVKRLYDGQEFEELMLDGMRRTIAARLSDAKRSIPHFYLRRTIALDALLRLRAGMNEQLKARGVKLSVNDFIVKACALSLQQVPECNSVWAGDRILRLKRSDVAVAVAIEGGLLTPVIRDADRKSLSSLSEEMKELASRARARKLAPHEYQGGSFSISNLGMMGVESFDAVINPPHASILAVGAALSIPVATKSGNVEVATVMSVTLSVDHRVIDGALGATFLGAIAQNLESPLAMLA